MEIPNSTGAKLASTTKGMWRVPQTERSAAFRKWISIERGLDKLPLMAVHPWDGYRMDRGQCFEVTDGLETETVKLSQKQGVNASRLIGISMKRKWQMSEHLASRHYLHTIWGLRVFHLNCYIPGQTEYRWLDRTCQSIIGLYLLVLEVANV